VIAVSIWISLWSETGDCCEYMDFCMARDRWLLLVCGFPYGQR